MKKVLLLLLFISNLSLLFGKIDEEHLAAIQRWYPHLDYKNQLLPEDGIIKTEGIAKYFAWSYLNHIYFSDYYGKDFIQMSDLSAKEVVINQDTIWLIYYNKYLIMKLSRANAAVIDINRSFVTTRERARVEDDGLVFDEGIAMAIASIVANLVIKNAQMDSLRYIFYHAQLRHLRGNSSLEKDQDIWVIKNNYWGWGGRSLYLFIRKSDGAILSILRDIG